jgi:hypothetical protein
MGPAAEDLGGEEAVIAGDQDGAGVGVEQRQQVRVVRVGQPRRVGRRRVADDAVGSP